MPSTLPPVLNAGLHAFFRNTKRSTDWGVAFELSTFISLSHRKLLYNKFHAEIDKENKLLEKNSPQKWQEILAKRRRNETEMHPMVFARSHTSLARLECIANEFTNFQHMLIPRASLIRNIWETGGKICIVKRLSDYIFFPHLFLQTIGLTPTEISQIPVFTNNWCAIDNGAIKEAGAYYNIKPKNMLVIDNDMNRVLMAKYGGFPICEHIAFEDEIKAMGIWIEKYRAIKEPIEYAMSYQ